MAERVTTKDVLDAIRQQGNQNAARYDAIARQMADFAAGQSSMERRMTGLETEMHAIKMCVSHNATDIAVIKDECPRQDKRLERLEDRERDGAIKQAGVTATIAGLVSWIIPWIKSQLGAP